MRHATLTALAAGLCLGLGALAADAVAEEPECGDALQIDHLIVAVADLEAGIAWLEESAGVRPVVGGAHPGRGTQNALLSLGDGRYLELLAPRPDAEATGEIAGLRRLEKPTPIGWAVSTRDLACTVRRLEELGYQVSEPSPGSREKPDGSTLAWTTFQLTAPQVPGAPFFIEWGEGVTHPAADSPAGCRLGSLAVVLPETAALDKLLRALRLDATARQGTPARYEITLDCPRGKLAIGGRSTAAAGSLSDVPDREVSSMNEIRVTSWNDLIQKLYDIPRTKHHRFRSNLVYRGLADQSWSLETSLTRLGPHHMAVERPLLRSFRKYAQPGSLPADDLWVQIAIAQHHGLPTRLMDWTVSPQVAVHFATAEENHYDKDAVVWCIDVVQARGLLPARLAGILDRESAFLFSVEMLQEVTLEELDRLGEEQSFVLFFEPPSLDGRIVNQGAIMSVVAGDKPVLSDLLEDHPQLYRRVIIPKEIKWEVRDKLDQDNVTERMLFPGLDGLSRWLKRYYGPGPGGPGRSG